MNALRACGWAAFGVVAVAIPCSVRVGFLERN